MQVTMRRVCGLVVVASVGMGAVGTAFGQLIRPDGASATSVFSSGYVAANMINGSGLPANFTVNDAHATYVSGNHWTTQAGRTIGESATFTFNLPTTIGGFHMWAHRSNNIASNPNYAVTRFDLVLRDGGGAVLGTYANLVGQSGVATAQTYGFPVTAGVRSVQFIVRATVNGNVSPYTGLAEVAFAPCVAATVSDPADVSVCPQGDAVFQVQASGSGPFTYQWRRDGVPINVNTNASAATSTLVLASVGFGGEGVVDCVVTGACGTDTSAAAALSVVGSPALPCDSLDFNNDCAIEPLDVDAYFSVLGEGPCLPVGAECNDLDFNNDGNIEPGDVDAYFRVLAEGPCL